MRHRGTGAGGTVHVDPPGEGRIVPDPSEGGEGDAVLLEPGGPGVTVVGVGDDEGVDEPTRPHRLVAVHHRAVPRRAEGHHVRAVLGGAHRQRAEEGGHRLVVRPRAERVDLDADRAGPLGAERLSGGRRLVAELRDRRLDPLECLRTHPGRMRQHVADRLPGDSGALRDVVDRHAIARPRHGALSGPSEPLIVQVAADLDLNDQIGTVPNVGHITHVVNTQNVPGCTRR